MSDIKEQVSGITNGKYATGGLYILFLGFAAGNFLPTIGDGIYFIINSRLRDKWKRGEISAKEYWLKDGLSYYIIPASWWLLLGGIIVGVGGDFKTKSKIAIGLISGSAVLGIILKKIFEDEKQLGVEDQEKLRLLKEHPEVVAILNKPE